MRRKLATGVRKWGHYRGEGGRMKRWCSVPIFNRNETVSRSKQREGRKRKIRLYFRPRLNACCLGENCFRRGN